MSFQFNDEERPQDYDNIWSKAWNNKTTRWDKGDISPALRELIEEKKWTLPHGRGIVPGCGSGYDAMFLANPKLHMTGADLSPLAVEAANKFRDFKEGVNQKYVKFEVLDFFNFDLVKEGGQYQVAYDYTFFCAIHPSMRPAWGRRYAEIMAPGSHLIVLMFPLSKDEDSKDKGPPFLVSEQDYHRVLDGDFELVHIDPNCTTHDSRAGQEVITVWQRKT